MSYHVSGQWEDKKVILTFLLASPAAITESAWSAETKVSSLMPSTKKPFKGSSLSLSWPRDRSSKSLITWNAKNNSFGQKDWIRYYHAWSKVPVFCLILYDSEAWALLWSLEAEFHLVIDLHHGEAQKKVSVWSILYRLEDVLDGTLHNTSIILASLQPQLLVSQSLSDIKTPGCCFPVTCNASCSTIIWFYERGRELHKRYSDRVAYSVDWFGLLNRHIAAS